MILIPASVGALMLHQPFHALEDAAGGNIAAGQQSQDTPGSLGRGAGARRKSLIVVAGAALAPAPVGVLNRADPLTGAQDVGFAIAFSGGAQAAQRQERAIDVI